jgi:hypothetical protein
MPDGLKGGSPVAGWRFGGFVKGRRTQGATLQNRGTTVSDKLRRYRTELL